MIPLLLLAACADTDGKDDLARPPDETCPADVEVTPLEVDLGAVVPGESASATVTVTNTGCDTLEIYGLAIDDDRAFTVSAIGSVLVAPGASSSFTVGFAPELPGEFHASVTLDTNDPDEPATSIALAGSGYAPRAEVDTSDCQLVEVPVGCTATCDIHVANTGTDDLVVSDLDVVSASDEFALDPAVNGALPWTLAPGTYAAVTLAYTPTDTFADEVYVSFTSDDPLAAEVTGLISASASEAGGC